MGTRRAGSVRRTWGALACLVLGASGCATAAPAYRRPTMTMPQTWAGAPTTDGRATVGTSFWAGFKSAELEALIAAAVAHNHDLAAAIERVAQARASLRAARAPLLPTVTAGADGSTRHTRRYGAGAHAEADALGLTAAYEVDLFGRNRSARDAADHAVEASELDRQALSLSLQADVATAYLQALSLRDRLAIAGENLETARELLRLIEVRLAAGADTALALAQQRAALANIEASVPALAQALAETLHALATLTGQAPTGFTVGGGSLASLGLPTPTVGSPAELLERRPDVLRAEAQLRAANANVGAARAALYPRLSVSASAGATGLITGGTTLFAELLGSLSQTLFAGGELRANVAYSEAARRELAETYLQAVLNALADVENGRAAARNEETRAARLQEAASQAGESYRLARIRYESGADDLLALLESQRTRLSAQDSYIQAQLARYVAAVSLFKALGGSS